jgi:hypothetical protein
MGTHGFGDDWLAVLCWLVLVLVALVFSFPFGTIPVSGLCLSLLTDVLGVKCGI